MNTNMQEHVGTYVAIECGLVDQIALLNLLLDDMVDLSPAQYQQLKNRLLITQKTLEALRG